MTQEAVMTDSWVIAVIILREPQSAQGTGGHIQRKHAPQEHGPVQEGVPVCASSSSTPCWRGVGIIVSRSLLCGAKHPA